MFSRIRLNLINAGRCKRFNSTGGKINGEAKKEQTAFRRTIDFMNQNRQGLLNILGMYFVLMFSVHNYKVGKAWKLKEKEVESYLEEITLMKSSILNADYCTQLEQKVKASKESVLLSELTKKFEEIEIEFNRDATEVKLEKLQKDIDDAQSKTDSADKDTVGFVVKNVGGVKEGRII